MPTIIRFSRLPSDRQRQAAALLFAHLSAGERTERIDQLLATITRGELNPDTILTAWWDYCVVGIQVVEILAGRTAALWAMRSRPGEERFAFEDALMKRAIELLNEAGVKVAQCLLLPDDGESAAALRRNRFHRLTRVRHLLGSVAPREASANRLISLQPFDDCDSAMFEQVLMQSFAGTLDCPELNELRSAEEVLAGHRASATDLSRWWLIRVRDQPVGVLILADAASPDWWDLAYLGVLPIARRQGVGRYAVDFALGQTLAAGKKGLTLMVDERNVPALHLYERAGFALMAEREVYLWTA